MIQFGDSVYVVENEKESQVMKETKQQLSEMTTLSDSSVASPVSLGVPSLSLQPWQGEYNFTIQVETATHLNSKVRTAHYWFQNFTKHKYYKKKTLLSMVRTAKYRKRN